MRSKDKSARKTGYARRCVVSLRLWPASCASRSYSYSPLIDYLADSTRSLSFHSHSRLRPKSGTASASDSGATPSIVYSARDPSAIDHYHTIAPLCARMVDRLVLAVTGQPDIAKAWSSLVAPNDKIGIKISAAGGELFTTHRDVVNAIVDGLVAAGHSRESIVVWDRELGGIKDAGYRPEGEGYRLIRLRRAMVMMRKHSFPRRCSAIWCGEIPNFRVPRAYGFRSFRDTKTRATSAIFARILSSEVTKMINVPVMSNSETNGLAGCLYNMTIPNIDNWRRFAIRLIWAVPPSPRFMRTRSSREKVVLHLMDGLVAQYAAGPTALSRITLVHLRDADGEQGSGGDRFNRSAANRAWRAKEKLPSLVMRPAISRSQCSIGSVTRILARSKSKRSAVETRDIPIPVDRLRGPILRSVSRSFYLSIHLFLHAARSNCARLLLARATDTIADTAEASTKLRDESLRKLARAIQGEISEDEHSRTYAIRFSPLQKNEAERTLIEGLPGCLEWLEQLTKKIVTMCGLFWSKLIADNRSMSGAFDVTKTQLSPLRMNSTNTPILLPVVSANFGRTFAFGISRIFESIRRTDAHPWPRGTARDCS